jgi:hypothetical protein
MTGRAISSYAATLVLGLAACTKSSGGDPPSAMLGAGDASTATGTCGTFLLGQPDCPADDASVPPYEGGAALDAGNVIGSCDYGDGFCETYYVHTSSPESDATAAYDTCVSQAKVWLDGQTCPTANALGYCLTAPSGVSQYAYPPIEEAVVEQSCLAMGGVWVALDTDGGSHALDDGGAAADGGNAFDATSDSTSSVTPDASDGASSVVIPDASSVVIPDASDDAADSASTMAADASDSSPGVDGGGETGP